MHRQTYLFFVAVALLLGGSVQVHGQTVDRNPPFRTPDQRYELRSTVWKLRTVEQVSSATPGWSPPGEFFKLSEDLLRYGSDEDFKKLLEDENPLVRVMGLVCLAQADFEKYSQTLRAHVMDQAEVVLHDRCIISKITVGKIVERLLKDPDFLGHKSANTPIKKAAQHY